MEREPFSLSGKHALVTGGGSGIGRAIARAFVNAGAYVTVTGRTESSLRDTVAELGSLADYAVHDVTDTGKTVTLVEELEARRPVDILVNNAGRHQKLPTLDTTDEAIRDVIDTNLLAVLSLSRECARHMVKRSGGSILMVLSMASLFGIPQVSAYTASKAGLAGLVRQLAVEWGPQGVRVNGIAPGFIDTAMSRKALDNDPPRKARVLTRTPLGRLGAVEEVAESAVFLSAPSGSYITGVILPVDGGTSIGF
ncbi:MAG: glucose 1-dehydrogenase [Spirochaetaceae bacterium]|nr:MAG: glucose 1-dehydrogenase [Spirochaetaceae bacterium]